MKPERLFYIVAALVVVLSSISHGQSSARGMVRANIPFSFILGNVTLQPGRYEVALTWQGTVWLTGPGGSVHAVGSHGASRNTAGESKLAFHHLEGHYFLEQVWLQGETAGRELPPMQMEREMLSTAKPDTVEVLVRK